MTLTVAEYEIRHLRGGAPRLLAATSAEHAWERFCRESPYPDYRDPAAYEVRLVAKLDRWGNAVRPVQE